MHTRTRTCEQNKYLQAKAHSGALRNLPKKYFENTFLGDFPLEDEEAFSTSNVHLLLRKMWGSRSQHCNTIEKWCSVMLYYTVAFGIETLQCHVNTYSTYFKMGSKVSLYWLQVIHLTTNTTKTKNGQYPSHHRLLLYWEMPAFSFFPRCTICTLEYLSWSTMGACLLLWSRTCCWGVKAWGCLQHMSSSWRDRYVK